MHDLLVDLIAQKKPLLIGLHLGRLPPITPGLVRQLDHPGVLEFTRAFLPQRGLPLRDYVGELKRRETISTSAPRRCNYNRVPLPEDR